MAKFCLILAVLFAQGCSTYRPSNAENLCDIFWGETDWYEDARTSQKRWGTSIPLMMAIIYQESSYRPKVRPERPKFFFIPLPRRSSAYGYAQAQDPAWNDYRKDTGNWGHDRDDFADAVNFVGWYTDKSQSVAGVSKWDAYSQYLAYHEGWGGYKRRSYSAKPQLLKAAAKVKRRTAQYGEQLKSCAKALDSEVDRWF